MHSMEAPPTQTHSMTTFVSKVKHDSQYSKLNTFRNDDLIVFICLLSLRESITLNIQTSALRGKACKSRPVLTA
jgi:hypothetical protein